MAAVRTLPLDAVSSLSAPDTRAVQSLAVARKVLLVDDDPLFRKLIRRALIERDLEVVEAGKVSEATTMFVAHNPDLAIVDGLLPDGRGTDWIAEIRHRGADIPVVFVSAFWRDLRSYEWLTRDLRVAFVGYKPIQPEQLARRVLELLDRQARKSSMPPPQRPIERKELEKPASRTEEPRALPAPERRPADAPAAVPEPRATIPDAAPPAPTDSPTTPEPPRAPQPSDAFARELPRIVSRMADSAFKVVRDSGDQNAIEGFRSLAHELAASARTFGFDDLADTAQDLALAGVAPPPELEEDGFWDIAKAAGIDDAAAKLPTTLARLFPRILLVDDDPVFAAHLVDGAQRMLIPVRAVTEADAAVDAVREKAADALLLGRPFHDPDRSGAVLKAAREARVPVIGVLSMDATFDARRHASRDGATLFFDHPIDRDAVFTSILEQHSLRVQVGRVGLVSHDAVFARALRDALQNLAINTEMFDDATALVDALERESLDAIALDEGLALGTETSAALRVDTRARSLAIVLLLPHDEPPRPYAAGADAALPRDAKPASLARDIAALVRRSREHRARIGRDPITGLPTTAHVLPQVAGRLAEARRSGRPLTVATVRIHEIETLRGKHGPLLADRALARLGVLVRSAFRETDIRGRILGDTLVLCLPGAKRDSLMPLFTRLASDFRALPLMSDEGQELRAALEVGVASFPQDGSALAPLLLSAYRNLTVV
jgi:diguanylate cyclase (GGDEF)-like protein